MESVRKGLLPGLEDPDEHKGSPIPDSPFDTSLSPALTRQGRESTEGHAVITGRVR